MFSKFIKFIIVVLITTASFAQAASLGSENGEGTGLNVTIFVFSGHTNPTYLLSGDSITQLVELFKTVQTESPPQGEMALPPMLEYNGILIDNPKNLGELPNRFRIFRERIEMESEENKQILTDSDKTVEKFLLKKALEKNVIDERILYFIETGEVPK